MRKIVSSKRRFMVLFNQSNLLQRSGRDGVLNLPLERRLFSLKWVLRDWGLESTICAISSRYNYYRSLGSFLVYNKNCNQMFVESVELLNAARNGGIFRMVQQMYLQAMPTPAWGFFDKKESHTKWLSATKWQINANTDIILQNCVIIKLSAQQTHRNWCVFAPRNTCGGKIMQDNFSAKDALQCL